MSMVYSFVADLEKPWDLEEIEQAQFQSYFPIFWHVGQFLALSPSTRTSLSWKRIGHGWVSRFFGTIWALSCTLIDFISFLPSSRHMYLSDMFQSFWSVSVGALSLFYLWTLREANAQKLQDVLASWKALSLASREGEDAIQRENHGKTEDVSWWWLGKFRTCLCYLGCCVQDPKNLCPSSDTIPC